MVIQGAEILLYPTAIGSEPQDQNLDSRDHWKRVMQGHAGANLVSPLRIICILHLQRLIFYFSGSSGGLQSSWQGDSQN